MLILTDNVAFADTCFGSAEGWAEQDINALAPGVRALGGELFETGKVMLAEMPGNSHWDCMVAVDMARKSQYDVLADLAGSGAALPARVLCGAGEGERFHGFKGRSWQARRGNIHLSAYVEPGQEISGAAAGFIVAAVVAVLQTVEAIDLQGYRPAIKWVNDVLVSGAKVGGVLARLQTQRGVVKSAVVGIGLNVEQRPTVERDPYVPDVAALAEFAGDPARCRHVDVFPRLVQHLGENIERLYRGEYLQLLDIYRERSAVVNRFVTIREDRQGASAAVIAAGRVRSIGPELELYIEGHERPVTKGRLVLGNDAPVVE